MNALNMKLENRESVANNKEKGVFSISKKCNKNQRKKTIPINVDKDASPTGNGLRCKPDDAVMESSNFKSIIPSESNIKKGRTKKITHRVDGKMLTKSDKVQERLQQFLSTEAKEKISCILNDIRTLSDVEKLFLYLQLPTGSPLEADPLKQKFQNPLGKKADEEGTTAIIWIQSHLEEDPDVSLPKQEVYDEYQSYCQVTGSDPLCAADFGKVMKQIFPSVKPRRLGTRGNSRYCYSGLRKKIKVEAPTLPNIQIEKENGKVEGENTDDEVTAASCHLLFEWAEKLLGDKFTSLKDLASHLLQNMYVDNRSVAAFTVLLATSPQFLEKGSQLGVVKCESGTKKSEAQIHLQRKIQEKELIKEQKKKLQEQRASLTGLNKGKSSCPKKKSSKSRKQRLASSPELHLDLNIGKIPDTCTTIENEECHTEEPNPADKSSIKQESNNTVTEPQQQPVTKSNQPPFQLPNVTSPGGDSLIMKLSPQQSPGSSSDLEDGAKGKVILSRSKTPVCIAQSLPGIIIVPSLPHVQIAEMGGKPCMSMPKYKRIQPKPLTSENFSSIVRSRASSFGSSILCKPRRQNDGRRSSHAWLPSDSRQENVEDCKIVHSGKSISPKAQKSSGRKGITLGLKEAISQSNNQKSNNQIFSEKTVHLPGDTEMQLSFLKNDRKNTAIEPVDMCEVMQGKDTECSAMAFDDCNSFKRHADETEGQSAVKRPHLEKAPNEEAVDDALSAWVSDICCRPNNSSNLIVQSSAEQQALVLSEEEVNVHDIEGDACDDYFPGAINNTSAFSSDLLLHGDAVNGKEIEIENKQLASNTTVRQLSQLRMLLESVVPTRVSKDQLLSGNTSLVTLHSNVLPSPVKKSYSMNAKKASVCENKSLAVNNMLNLLVNSENVTNSQWSKLKHSSFSRIKSLESILPSRNITQMPNTEKSPYATDPLMFLSNEKESQLINANGNNTLGSINHSSQMPDMMSSLSLASDSDLVMSKQVNCNRVSTYTQVPSVPQSPNTRRRAFNFMPISPRHTPVPEPMTQPSCSSPIPNHQSRMISTAVGPSQPPSNAGSPFVSPRSTPVPLCRSRHNSGQSTYSASRHTPFQNIDSGVSSVSTSPFISPQPTPVPVSRLRHNSSHCKTVTFSSVNNPQVINAQTLGQLRARHSSGPGGPHFGSSSKSAPLSPLVNDHCTSAFIFPSTNSEVRSRHSSGSNMTPLSPVSEQTSPSSSCASNFTDIINATDTSSSLSHSFLNDGAGDLLISGNPAVFKHVRQRHASSSVIYNKPSLSFKDPLSQEVQMFLKNVPSNGMSSDPFLSNRSHSVPLHQMLQNLDSFYLISQPLDDPISKSHPTTPLANQAFTFQHDPMLLDRGSDKAMEWSSGIESGGASGDIEMSSRRNLTSLLDDAPIGDDLQTTLEDLRDCDTDFSKFAQELELSQHEEVSL